MRGAVSNDRPYRDSLILNATQADHASRLFPSLVTRGSSSIADGKLIFLGAIAHLAAEGQAIRLPPAFLQPIASDDVPALMADFTVGGPINGMVEIAGPELVGLAEMFSVS